MCEWLWGVWSKVYDRKVGRKEKREKRKTVIY